jgi:hypothetical protein
MQMFRKTIQRPLDRRSAVDSPVRQYRGQPVSQVPADYLRWLEGVKREELHELQYEMENRGVPARWGRPEVRTTRTTQTLQEIVEAGYRALAMKYHPDHGGDSEKMRDLNLEIARWRAEAK